MVKSKVNLLVNLTRDDGTGPHSINRGREQARGKKRARDKVTKSGIGRRE